MVHRLRNYYLVSVRVYYQVRIVSHYNHLSLLFRGNEQFDKFVIYGFGI